MKPILLLMKKIVVEIKSVSRLTSTHDAQAIHYLAATGLQLAILINFGETSLLSRRVVRTEKSH
jgi:GxxExxY protein